jgi:formylglycine-generating enzyme required for sulfatase activity
MKLFMSYARVDKPYCTQIIEALDVHDVWYDQRLHAGQQWWEEIQRRLSWCEGLVFLLSPDSVKSEYCQKELEIARSLGKHIFPVLIHASTTIPDALTHIQYADLSRGLTVEAMKQLLNSIYIGERQGIPTPVPLLAVPSPVKVAEAPRVNPQTVIDEIADAMDEGNYDRAVFLLKQVRAAGYESRFINIEAMLMEAEAALERQAYLREAEREYRPIVALIMRQRTRELGVKAFMNFRSQFPDYDPENIAPMYATAMLPLLEWCPIPSGETTIQYESKNITYFVENFYISKYPVTNGQFQVFLDAHDGYSNPKWWNFSPYAQLWREQNAEALPTKFAWGDHPRANISWYEAMAFCGWLSAQTGLNVSLPTEQQWQRAAQGDDDRLYPWGNRFEKSRCNSKESNLRTTTPVNRYTNGVSPYGIYDMAGNVWEWCSSTEYRPSKSEDGEDVTRVVRGGAFISVAQRARNNFHFYLNPLYRYATIGFRVVMA